MNVAGSSNNDILFANFNQDYTCLSVGTKHGYKMYNCDPFGKCFGKSMSGMGSLRDTKVCELSFKTAVLAVKLNRKRLVVVLESCMHIYDITVMKLLHSVETPPNPKGLVALSANSDNNYLAYLASSVSGEILVFDALNLQAANIVQAHKTPVSALSFNFTGTMLATASGKGTVIRVFSIPEGQKLYQFRRGTYPANIYSLSFNIQSTLLAVSSDSDTVHIFKLDERAREQAKAAKRRPPSGISSWMPEMLTDMWEPERDFAWLKLPRAAMPNLCAISNSTPLVMVVTAEGMFYHYSLNLQDGGECVLLNKYSLLDSADGKEEALPQDL